PTGEVMLFVAEKVFVVPGQIESGPTTKLSPRAATPAIPKTNTTTKGHKWRDGREGWGEGKITVRCLRRTEGIFPAPPEALDAPTGFLELFLPDKLLKVRPKIARLHWHGTASIGLS